MVYLDEAQKFTNINKMVINKKKTHAILFSRSKKFDFPPELLYEDGSMVKIVSETTLLGVIITDNLKWSKNTEFICLKARRKLWTLKRMLLLELNELELFDVYKKKSDQFWNTLLRSGTRVCPKSKSLKSRTFKSLHSK